MNFVSKYLAGAAILIAATLSPQVMASSLFSYDYAQISYVDMGNDFDGLAVAGSYDVHPQIAITASYTDVSEHGWDYSRLAIGAAHHGKFDKLKNADLALHAEYVRGSRGFRGNDDDENAIRLGSTIRLQVQPNLEVSADVSFSTLYDNELQFTPAVLLHITPTVAAEVSYQLSDEILMFGARIQLK